MPGRCCAPAYDAPPEADPLASSASPRILQLLLQLERAGEWPTARGLATQIDRESRDELAVIPLWQLADHYAWRSRLRGPAETADQLYEHLEQWEISPWIARDPWDTPRTPRPNEGRRRHAPNPRPLSLRRSSPQSALGPWSLPALFVLLAAGRANAQETPSPKAHRARRLPLRRQAASPRHPPIGPRPPRRPPSRSSGSRTGSSSISPAIRRRGSIPRGGPTCSATGR